MLQMNDLLGRELFLLARAVGSLLGGVGGDG